MFKKPLKILFKPFVIPCVARDMDIVRNLASVDARWDIWEKIVPNVILILAAKKELVIDHGYSYIVFEFKKVVLTVFNFKECNCEQGFGGMLCDEELNYCEKNPNTCENGGKCTSLTKDDGNYKCECPSGWFGDRCDRLTMIPTTTELPSTTPANTSMKDAKLSIVTPATILAIPVNSYAYETPILNVREKTTTTEKNKESLEADDENET